MKITVSIFCLLSLGIINAEADLCAVRNGGCEQICAVVGGQRICSCRDGFDLNHDQRTCHDEDLCKVNNGGCEQFCSSDHAANKITCTCKTGMEPIPGNPSACQFINLCAINRGGCQQMCESRNGTLALCSCRKGFALNDDKKTCYDADLCAKDNGGCEEICTNVKNGVVCSCPLGKQQDPADEKRCADIKKYVSVVREYLLKANDECKVDNGGCSQFCRNTIDYRECYCDADSELGRDGKTCEKWHWYWTLIIILAIFVLLIILCACWCCCGKFRWLSENICCKCFLSWRCCLSGIFCKCNRKSQGDTTELYYHQVELKVSPFNKEGEAKPLTEADDKDTCDLGCIP